MIYKLVYITSKKSFLQQMKNYQFQFWNTSAQLWTSLYVIAKSLVRRLNSSESKPKHASLSL